MAGYSLTEISVLASLEVFPHYMALQVAAVMYPQGASCLLSVIIVIIVIVVIVIVIIIIIILSRRRAEAGQGGKISNFFIIIKFLYYINDINFLFIYY
jgi:heme/copper-type cytochrome/quinol oxidase subunit 2